MTCLKDETLAALARGVIPQGELGRIRAHLPECPRCLDAVARRSRSRGGGARPAEAPAATRVAPAQRSTGAAPPARAPRRRSWGVVAVTLMVALAGLWVAPDSVRAGARGALARAADAARGAATAADAAHVWSVMRGLVELPARPAPGEGTGAPHAGRVPEPLLREASAASARIAEASRLVERSNAAAAPSQAAGGP